MEQRRIEQVLLDRIVCGENVRKHYDEQTVLGLSQSMRESGLREPIHLISYSKRTCCFRRSAEVAGSATW
jgi:hypothetical protein